MMLGYDLDGTLCGPWPKRPKPYFHQTGIERREFNTMLEGHCRTVKPTTLDPKAPYVIITSRQKFLRELTKEWVAANLDPQPEKIYFIDRPRTRNHMIDFKAESIVKAGVKMYFEDDPAIAKGLTKRGLRVTLVKRKKDEHTG